MTIRNIDDIEKEKHDRAKEQIKDDVTNGLKDLFSRFKTENEKRKKEKKKKESKFMKILKLLGILGLGLLVLNFILVNIWLLKYFITSIFNL